MPLVIVKFVSPFMALLANPDTGIIVRKAHVSQLEAYFPAVSLYPLACLAYLNLALCKGALRNYCVIIMSKFKLLPYYCIV
jgi:hypothetical protein